MWDVDDLDCAEELRDAVKTVREDSDESVVVEGDSIWMYEVYWNDNTDSVWVSLFGYHGGFEVQAPVGGSADSQHGGKDDA